MCCKTDGNPWSVKQHHWKSEAKEDNQLSPGGPSNRRKLRSQPTKMNSFRSGPSWSLYILFIKCYRNLFIYSHFVFVHVTNLNHFSLLPLDIFSLFLHLFSVSFLPSFLTSFLPSFFLSCFFYLFLSFVFSLCSIHSGLLLNATRQF